MADIATDLLRDARRDEVAVTVLKFLIAFAVGTFLYALGVLIVAIAGEIAVHGFRPVTGLETAEFVPDLFDFLWDHRGYLLIPILPAIPAALTYLHLPERTVDRYHRLGKAFAMFLVVNLTLSGLFMFHEFFVVESTSSVNVLTVIVYFSLASAFLPGPYLGVLMASRWSR